LPDKAFGISPTTSLQKKQWIVLFRDENSQSLDEIDRKGSENLPKPNAISIDHATLGQSHNAYMVVSSQNCMVESICSLNGFPFAFKL
jgi:hypothetical protein